MVVYKTLLVCYMYIVLLSADGPEQLPVPVPLVRNLTMMMMLI